MILGSFMSIIHKCSANGSNLTIQNNVLISKLYVELTNICNSGCVHCFNNSVMSMEEAFFDFAPVEHLLNNSPQGFSEVILSGGEVFRVKNLLDTIIFLSSVAPVKLLTNGSIYNRAVYEYIACNNIKTQISLIGHNETIDSCVRGGIYKKTIENIKILVALGAGDLITVSVAICAFNAEWIEEIIMLCTRLKVNTVMFTFVQKQGSAIDVWDELQLTNYQKLNLMREIYQQKLKYGNLINITTSGFKQHFAPTIQNQKFDCSKLSQEIYLSFTNKVSLCPKLTKFSECMGFELDAINYKATIEIPFNRDKCCDCNSQKGCVFSCV